MAGRMVLVFAKIRWFHRHKIATFCHNITGPQDQEWRIVRQQTLRFHQKTWCVFTNRNREFKRLYKPQQKGTLVCHGWDIGDVFHSWDHDPISIGVCFYVILCPFYKFEYIYIYIYMLYMIFMCIYMYICIYLRLKYSYFNLYL